MATESFFDTYVINREDIDRFVEIMNSNPKIKNWDKSITCEDVKGEELEALVKRLLNK